MIIVVNSHINSKIARDHLFESLKKCKEFEEFEFYVFIGGHYELENNYQVSKENNITYINCYHNSIDFTCFISLFELRLDINNIYFIMHDTMRVGELFFKKLKSINLNGLTSMKLGKTYSMNMGFYTQKIINNFGKFLSNNFKNKNENFSKIYKFKCIHYEDFIFKNDPNCKLIGEDSYKDPVITGPTNYYNTGTMRIVEYFENIDAYKIKANYFITDDFRSNELTILTN